VTKSIQPVASSLNSKKTRPLNNFHINYHLPSGHSFCF